MAGPPKLDIFETLAAIDRRRGDWLGSRPEDAQRGFVPIVVLRWASAVSDNREVAEYYLRSINERANPHLWEIAGQHPELVYRLLASCGIGRQHRHEWIAGSARRKGSSKPRDLIARLNPMASETEIDLLLSLHTPESFVALVKDAGLPPTEEKELIKAYGATDPEAEAEKPRKGRRRAKL